MSESQILGADEAFEAPHPEHLTIYKTYIFCSAAAWHKA
jgi:hypothetical protein